ncbi:hypothetical protein LXL04_014026 [Taraxacum kok-saghyz]
MLNGVLSKDIQCHKVKFRLTQGRCPRTPSELTAQTPLTALYLRRTATANTSVRRPLSSAAVAPSVSSIAAPRATTSTAAPSRNPPPRRSSPSQAVRPTFLSSASLHLHSRSHRRSSYKPPRNPPAPLDLTTAAQSNSPAPALLPPTEATTQPQQRLRANPLPSRDQNQVAGKNTNNLLDDSAPPQAATSVEDESSPKTWNLRPRRPPMKHKFSICGERRWRWSRGLLHCFTNSQFATSMAASWYDFNSGTVAVVSESMGFGMNKLFRTLKLAVVLQMDQPWIAHTDSKKNTSKPTESVTFSIQTENFIKPIKAKYKPPNYGPTITKTM